MYANIEGKHPKTLGEGMNFSTLIGPAWRIMTQTLSLEELKVLMYFSFLSFLKKISFIYLKEKATVNNYEKP